MRLGVIGGLGPMATACFMQLVTTMTAARCDQEHLEMLVYSVPSVPDRTRFILGQSGDSPVPPITGIGRQLIAQGADVLAIPCMTAHYFHETLQQSFSVPLIHGIRCTAQLLKQSGVCCTGIMATDGTIASGLFQRELEAVGVKPLIPDPEHQAGVMKLIYEDIKANRPADMTLFHSIAEELYRRGAETIILGCTELSVIKTTQPLDNSFVDAMEVLAAQAVSRCGKPLRTEYQPLISGLQLYERG